MRMCVYFTVYVCMKEMVNLKEKKSNTIVNTIRLDQMFAHYLVCLAQNTLEVPPITVGSSIANTYFSFHYKKIT